MINNMVKLIKRSDPRILLFAAITILAVVFSIYKAADSLSGTEVVPEYRNRPPEAFAQPLPVTLVDPGKLTAGRLSDQGYQFAITTSQKISKLIAARNLGPGALQQAGMSPSERQTALRTIQGQYNAYRGRQAALEGPPELSGDTSVDAAGFIQKVRYGPAKSGAPGGSLAIYYQFVAGGPTPWRLSEIKMSFD